MESDMECLKPEAIETYSTLQTSFSYIDQPLRFIFTSLQLDPCLLSRNESLLYERPQTHR